MRVLFLYPGFRSRARRLQYDFIIQLEQYCDFFIYGKKIHHPEFSPLDFKSNRSAKDIIDYYKPDVILFHMWDMYINKNGIPKRNCTPEGIEEINHIPKIMFECDYWSLPDYGWYRRMGFDLIIQRGWFEGEDIPSVWLPFSATEEFYPMDVLKKNKILFVGGLNKKNPLYNTRRKAINILSNNGLLENKNRFDWKDYPTSIQDYTCGLSCGCSEVMSPVGKTFEYMAAGIATLCSPMHGSDILFDNKECFFEYDIDCNNVLDIAKLALNDIKYRQFIINNAVEITHKQHMDKHRIVELYDILKTVVEGKSIPKKWSH